MTETLPEPIRSAVATTIADWESSNRVQRIWDADASLWTGSDESNWLGWLTISQDVLADADRYEAFGEEVRNAGFKHVLLLGMGGSSLCPEVLRLTLDAKPGSPSLHVLDSTDPRQIAATEAELDLTKTVVIVSTKSGGTLEPNILKDYFLDKIGVVAGPHESPKHFVAVTDPGSPFEGVAKQTGFRHIFYGLPSIGGRYSALSAFGIAPAAAAGFDFVTLLKRAESARMKCEPGVHDNPGLKLGAILGECVKAGRDKVTLVTSQGIASLGTWLEQLLAESTGKQGKGIVPIDREPLGSPEVYGSDRLFAHLRLASDADSEQIAALKKLADAGHPVVEIVLSDALDLGREFFHWEFATAVAGAIIGINPFDQPDVEASKIVTKKITSDYEETGHLPAETPLLTSDGVAVYADEANAGRLGTPTDLRAALGALLDQIQPGDYFALLAYIPMTDEHAKLMTEIRLAVRAQKHVATCGEFGPRFLHSTGQAYKGGPNSGVFLQITCDEPADLQVPGKKYTFGVVKAAQARGDLAVLDERDRRSLRLHLGRDVSAGLRAVLAAVGG